jgi:hypothetical protein
METVPSELVKLECVLSSKNLPRPCIMMPYSYWKWVTKSNITSPYPTLCIHGCIAMVGPWILCMNRATGRKSFHGPSHDKMGATKPKAPATWVDCRFLSSYFSNIHINYSKICTAGSSVIECSCRDMKQYPPRVNQSTDTKNSRGILHFLVNVGATSTTQYHPTYYKNVESCCLFNLRLLVQPKSLLDVGGTNEFAWPMPPLFLVNCWFSNFMNFSSINVSDTKTWISTYYLWGATWDSWKSHLLLMRLAASTKFLTRLIGFSPWIMAPWTPHFQNHQLPCFWHETVPVISADH